MFFSLSSSGTETVLMKCVYDTILGLYAVVTIPVHVLICMCGFLIHSNG